MKPILPLFFSSFVLSSIAAAQGPLGPLKIVQEAYIKPAAIDAADFFGHSIAVSGNTAVVGAPLEASGAMGSGGDALDNSQAAAGAAYVFVRTGGVWTQQAYLKASNTGNDDHFGLAVDIDGDTLVVGAYVERSAASGVNGNQSDNSLYAAGAAYVFVRSGTTWVQEAYLKASNTDADDWFGYSVSISGDTIAVGAPREDGGMAGVGALESDNSAADSGAVYIFKRSGATWSQEAYIKSSNPDSLDSFGFGLDLSGDTLAVGAKGEASAAMGFNGNQGDNSLPRAGAAYVFDRVGAVWSQTAYLKASNTEGDDFFGQSLELAGDTLLVGAPGEDSAATGVGGDQADNSLISSGAVYEFVRTAGAWGAGAYIKPPSTHDYQGFGWSLASSAGNWAIGASGSPNSTYGVNGNLSDAKGFLQGELHLMVESGGVWSHEALLKPQSPDDWDSFGTAAAMDGNVLLVGASVEDSASIGINGDATNNTAPDAGAVYAFDLAATSGAFRYGDYIGANTADLYTSGLPVSGANVTLQLTDFVGSGAAVLLISGAPSSTPLLGGTLLADLTQSLFGSGALLGVAITAGAGQLSLPAPPGMAGFSFYAQAAMPDPSQPYGWSMTNGLELTLGL